MLQGRAGVRRFGIVALATVIIAVMTPITPLVVIRRVRRLVPDDPSSRPVEFDDGEGIQDGLPDPGCGTRRRRTVAEISVGSIPLRMPQRSDRLNNRNPTRSIRVFAYTMRLHSNLLR